MSEYDQPTAPAPGGTRTDPTQAAPEPDMDAAASAIDAVMDRHAVPGDAVTAADLSDEAQQAPQTPGTDGAIDDQDEGFDDLPMPDSMRERGDTKTPPAPAGEIRPEHQQLLAQRYSESEVETILALPPEQRQRFVDAAWSSEQERINQINPQLMEAFGYGHQDPATWAEGVPPSLASQPPQPPQAGGYQPQPGQPQQPAPQLKTPIDEVFSAEEINELEQLDSSYGDRIRGVSQYVQQQQQQLSQLRQQSEQLRDIVRQQLSRQARQDAQQFFDRFQGDPLFKDVYHGPQAAKERGRVVQAAYAMNAQAEQEGRPMTAAQAYEQAHRWVQQERIIAAAQGHAVRQLKSQIQTRHNMRTVPASGAGAPRTPTGKPDQATAEQVVGEVLARHGIRG
jgi:TolA-binding protein